MKRLILVSATALEIEPTLDFIGYNELQTHAEIKFNTLTIDVCITGVGMVNTAFELGKRFHNKYNMALNAGIAGTFKNHSIGQVLNVTSDCYAELGAEDGDRFLTIDALGFGEQQLNVLNPLILSTTKNLPNVFGISVNTVHGNDKSIETVKKLVNPDIETMESAAFIQAANAYGCKTLQLRAISNVVERRNRDNWNIPLAIKNLNSILIQALKEINDAN